MKKVMAFGTFDIFHKGHESYLKQAKKLGDYLIVVVARDKTVLRIKKQETGNKEQERLEKIKSNNLVDEVVLGSLKNKYVVIKKYKPDVIALGYDQKVNLIELKEKLKKFKLKSKIARLKSYKPEIYKSSKLKNNYGTSNRKNRI
jgi:FAD synthetase